MATYLISFRIANDSTYADRYMSVVNAIKSNAEGGKTWDETTSLFVLTSSLTADALAASIYVHSSFYGPSDTLLVVNALNGTYATRGKVQYPATLASLFPGKGLGLSLFG